MGGVAHDVRDGRDGAPPTNWRAAFGGDAWTWDERTRQWYLHLFLPQQPDLNWNNPDVVAAQHDVLRFWLDRGVDGFRADVVHLIGKDDVLDIQRVYLGDRALPASQGACRQQANGRVLTEIDCEAVVGGQRQAVAFVVEPMPPEAIPAAPSAPTSP